jgi:hypothetical protein
MSVLPYANAKAHVPRRRWWRYFVVIVGVIAASKVWNYKPQRYHDEAIVMEQIADLLNSPVPYQREVGFSGCPYVTCVYLPRVELHEATTHQLADLLKKLPQLYLVDVRYLRDGQPDRISQLKAEMAERVEVDVGSWTSNESLELQRSALVAGIAARL